jgi:hypothetical protein
MPHFGTNVKHKFVNTRGSALQISANHVFKKKLNSKKKFKKKIQKKILKIFREIFFLNFFGLSRFHIQFGACLRTFGGSRPASLGGDRERTYST